jgi:hypothetical protein
MKRSAISLALLLAVLPARAADAPPVSIELHGRQATGVPVRSGCTHTGGGNIDVKQPSPDTLVITMTGVAVATGHPCKDSLATLTFDLCQDLEIVVADKKTQKVKVTLEASVIGLLRTHKYGTANINCPGHAAVLVGGTPVVEVSLPGRAACCRENLSVNDHEGPRCVVIPPGCLKLVQQFAITATHPCKLVPCKAASAEFAPDPALDPLWISAFEPFHGAAKKDFGFVVTLKVAVVE